MSIQGIEARDSNLPDGTVCQVSNGIYYFHTKNKEGLQPTLPAFIKQNGQWSEYTGFCRKNLQDIEVRDSDLPYGAICREKQDGQGSEEYTGGSSSYYTVHVKNPTTEGRPAYDAECNDIIEALGMNYAEGNSFKAIWRRAAARKGMRKKGYDNGLYDAEKVEFFGKRLIEQSKESK